MTRGAREASVQVKFHGNPFHNKMIIDVGVTCLDKNFMDLNFPEAIQLAYPFKFSPGASSLFSHDFVDSVNFMYPTGSPMTDLAEHHRALQVTNLMCHNHVHQVYISKVC